MTAPAAAASNADQIAYWNGKPGAQWARQQITLDAQFAALTDALFAKAAIAPGESVLDVGCGAGATTLACAEKVGPKGRVLGVDVSEALLTVARERAKQAGYAHVDFALADASTHAFAPASFDRLISRFGVMFFLDPEGAFVHLHAALKPGGRLDFICWQPPSQNPFFALPIAAVAEVIPVEPSDPRAPGPFAFSEPARVEGILKTAGFRAIEVEPFAAPMPLGPHGDIDGVFKFLSRIGPAARLLHEAPDEHKPAITARLRAIIEAHDGPDGIAMEGAVWVVSAKA